MKNGERFTPRVIILRSAIPAGTHILATFFNESDRKGDFHEIESASRHMSAIIRLAESGYSFASFLRESIASLREDWPEFQKTAVCL